MSTLYQEPILRLWAPDFTPPVHSSLKSWGLAEVKRSVKIEVNQLQVYWIMMMVLTLIKCYDNLLVISYFHQGMGVDMLHTQKNILILFVCNISTCTPMKFL